MKFTKCLASISVTMAVGLAAPLAWGQATEPGMAGSTPAPAAVSPIVPAERIAPGVPGIPPNAPGPIGGTSDGSRVDAMKADYLAQKTLEAQGKHMTTAASREAMGKAALGKRMNDEATKDSEAALRSIGVIPTGLDEDTGESNTENQRMRDAN
jgi:hypothetical protein